MSKDITFFRLISLAAIATVLFVSSCEWGHGSQGSSVGSTSDRVSSASSAAVAVRTPDPSVAASNSAALTDADFELHVRELKASLRKKLSGDVPRPSGPGRVTDETYGFSTVVQKPFVVIGDEPQKVVQQHAVETVKWAVDLLKQDFFTQDPVDILDIWLFKDDASYQKHTLLLFADRPTTPYGYYSPAHKALIMNISTGGGTLVHEIVHPFIEANFPACPPWLNEGLGSLYEQCGEIEGHIHGFTNWRLPGLQRAIAAHRVPPFENLMAMNANAFYNEDKGTNYAQSRYLCYYLQEKGLLRKFYKEFLTRQKEDASGFKTLKMILGESDMDAFKIKWQAYVSGLRQGYSVTVE